MCEHVSAAPPWQVPATAAHRGPAPPPAGLAIRTLHVPPQWASISVSRQVGHDESGRVDRILIRRPPSMYEACKRRVCKLVRWTREDASDSRTSKRADCTLDTVNGRAMASESTYYGGDWWSQPDPSGSGEVYYHVRRHGDRCARRAERRSLALCRRASRLCVLLSRCAR